MIPIVTLHSRNIQLMQSAKKRRPLLLRICLFITSATNSKPTSNATTEDPRQTYADRTLYPSASANPKTDACSEERAGLTTATR